MRLKTATRYPDYAPMKKFGAFIDRLWETSLTARALDAATRKRSLARLANDGIELPKELYGSPRQGEQDSLTAAVGTLEAAFPGYQVKAIGLWGRSRSRENSFEKVDFKIGFLCVNEEGKSRLACVRQELPSRIGSLDGYDHMVARWAIDEQVAWVRRGERWIWTSPKQTSENTVRVKHLNVAMGRDAREAPRAESGLFSFAVWRIDEWAEGREEKIQQRAERERAKQERKAAEEARAQALSTPLGRAKELLPEEHWGRATAMAEAEELRVSMAAGQNAGGTLGDHAPNNEVEATRPARRPGSVRKV